MNMHRRWRADHALIAIALIPTMSGCSTPVVCTAVGADAGVQFDFHSIVAQHRDSSLIVRACVDKTCKHTVLTFSPRSSDLQVVDPEITDATPVEVTLTILDREQREVFAGRTSVLPEKYQPNGPDCAPTVWRGGVVAKGDNQLVPR